MKRLIPSKNSEQTPVVFYVQYSSDLSLRPMCFAFTSVIHRYSRSRMGACQSELPAYASPIGLLAANYPQRPALQCSYLAWRIEDSRLC